MPARPRFVAAAIRSESEELRELMAVLLRSNRKSGFDGNGMLWLHGRCPFGRGRSRR